jgi:hypothetical protein
MASEIDPLHYASTLPPVRSSDQADSDAYENLCSHQLLELAYADAKQRFLSSGQGCDVLNSVQKDRLIAELARDLENYAYRPSSPNAIATASTSGPTIIRDLVVQSALKLAFGSCTKRMVSFQAEEVVQWIARAAEKGLSRVYAERLEVGPSILHEQESGKPSLGLLINQMLAAYPSLVQEKTFVPLWFDYVFRDIDSMLEQANLIGRGDAHAPVKGARFSIYFVVLVDPDPQYDWVVPGVQHRLRKELSKIKGAVDSCQTQHVDLERGDKLTFWGYELWANEGRGRALRVSYHLAKNGLPAFPGSALVCQADTNKPTPPRKKKPAQKPAKKAKEGRASGRSRFTFRWHMPRINLHQLVLGLNTLVAAPRKHKSYILTITGLVVLAMLFGVYVLSSMRPKLAESFYRDFRGGAAGRPLAPFGPSMLDMQSLDEGGLHITLARKRARYGPVGMRTMFGARGDFTITVDYEILQAERPDSGWGAGVFLWLKKASHSVDTARLGRALDADENQVFKWDRAIADQAGARVTRGHQLAGKDVVGRLRFVRNGSTLSYFVAGGKNARFSLVHEEDFGKEDIESFRIAVTSDDRPCLIEARFVELDFKSDQSTNLDSDVLASGPSRPLLMGKGLPTRSR